MKFLCVPCDEPMKLLETATPDRGSISLVYSCDQCGYEFAMLTNPLETQMVSSLGVKMGPDGEATGESKCPFSSMMQSQDEPDPAVPGAIGGGMAWTEAAQEKMQTVPEFVRPMAISGIEKYAIEKGYEKIDEKVLTEARDHFGVFS